MAWKRVQYNKLCYKIGATGTPVNMSGVCPIIAQATGLNAPNTTATNIGYRYDDTYLSINALPGQQVGCELWQVLNNMSVGQRLYIYNPDIGDMFSFTYDKVNATFFRYGVSVYGSYTQGSNLSISTPDNGYSEGAYSRPYAWLGFYYNDATLQFVPMATKGYPSTSNRLMFYGVIDAIAANNIFSTTLAVIFTNNMPTPKPPSADPYESGGTSSAQTGAATGNFDDTSDSISVPSSPALNLSLNHFLSAYVPTLTQLNDLADYIWGNYDKTDSSKVLSKILANPQDAIVGLFMLPFTPGSSTAIEVTIGSYGTSVNMAPLTAQFVDVDCGTLTIEEYWGNYLDYNPYTRITLFLPGVGEVQLDPDEVMGVSLSVLYRVDCLTGNFVCFVSGDNKIFAQYQGNCALQVPISSADYSRLNQAMLQAALGAVGAVAGVATAGGAVAAAMEGAEAAAGGASTALNIMNSKVNHSHSGTLSGSGFFMGSQKPYVIIHRARQSVPEYANKYYGYPCNVTFTLGDLEGSGFTSVKSIILDGLPYTDGELQELRSILAAGVIL